MPPSEADLCRKLLTTLHLNVPERRALPGGRARFSALVDAAEAILAEDPCLPPGSRLDESLPGVVIEAVPEGYRVHQRFEVGVGRVSPVQSYLALGLAEAVGAYLQWAGGWEVDGIRIDYGA